MNARLRLGSKRLRTIPCGKTVKSPAIGEDGGVRNRRRILAVPGPVPLWRDPRLLSGLALIAVSILACVWLVAQAKAGVSVYRATRSIAVGEVLDSTNTALVDVRVDAAPYLLEGELAPGAFAKRSMSEGELIARESTTDETDQNLRRFVVTVADGLPSSAKAGDAVELWALPSERGSEAEKQSHLLAPATLVRILDEEQSLVRAGSRIEILVEAGSLSRILDATSGRESLAAVPVGAA